MIARRLSRAACACPVALLLCAALLLGGCAKKPLPDYGPAAPTWGVFNAHFRTRPPAPAFVTATSLAWTSGKKSARILLDVWGGFKHAAPPHGNAPDAVVRMDAWSNLGGSLSKLRENGHGLAAFYPDQLKAYTHADPVLGARLLGLPFPFSLADFAALLFGDFTDLVPEHYDAAVAQPDGGFRYEFRSGRVAELTLDSAARPVSMSGQTVAPPGYEDRLGGEWRIDFSNYPEQADPLPAADENMAQASETLRAPMATRLFLTLPGGHRGSLRIQSRELRLSAWPDEALTLILPEGIEPRALDGAPRDWTTGRPADEEQASPVPQQQ